MTPDTRFQEKLAPSMRVSKEPAPVPKFNTKPKIREKVALQNKAQCVKVITTKIFGDNHKRPQRPNNNNQNKDDRPEITHGPKVAPK